MASSSTPSEVATAVRSVLTVSDRAAKGAYEDLGGPEVTRVVEEYVARVPGCSLELAQRAEGGEDGVCTHGTSQPCDVADGR